MPLHFDLDSFYGKLPEEKPKEKINLPSAVLEQLGLTDQASQQDIEEAQRLKEAGLLIPFPSTSTENISPENTQKGANVQRNVFNVNEPTQLQMGGVEKVGTLSAGQLNNIVPRNVEPFFTAEQFQQQQQQRSSEQNIQAGLLPRDVQNFFNNIAKGVGTSASDFAKSVFTTGDLITNLILGAPIGQGRFGAEVNNQVISKFDNFLENYIPTVDPDSFFGSKLPQGIGSAIFFMAGGLAGGESAIGGKLMASVLGAGQMSQQMYDDAKRRGATDGQLLVNYLSGLGLGATEGLLGIGRLADKIGEKTGSTFVKDVLVGGAGEEAFQEMVQQLGQNLTVQQTYDMSQDLLDGVGESGALALITGGLFSGLVHSYNRLAQQQDINENDKRLLNAIDQNIEKIKEKYTNRLTDTNPVETQKVPTERTGQQNTDFFTQKSEAPSSDIPYKPVIQIDQNSATAKDYKKFSNNPFTGHISKMIPSFMEKQIQVADAIKNSGAKNFLDIGTSEGGMIKTVSNGTGINSVGVDPNTQMKKNFESTPPVKGAEFKQEAWQASWTDPDGTHIPEFRTNKKFDVVNEDFAFQFMNNNREKQVTGVKNLMAKDGIFITSEKFHTANEQVNELRKLEHQKQYFTPDQLTEDKQTIVNGMSDDMVNDKDYENTLRKHFNYVEEFWNAGNFKGYLASDSKETIDQYKQNIGDLTNPYTDVSTSLSDITYSPRVIQQIVNDHNNNEGSTTNASGTVTKGYAVGTQIGTGLEIKGKNVTHQDISDFVANHQEDLQQEGNAVGTWYEKGTNTTHIDVVKTPQTEREAQRYAEQNQQKAIFDIQNQKLIETTRKSQLDIPVENVLPLYHFSDMTNQSFVTDPKRYGQNTYTRKTTGHDLTYFYVDPKGVDLDTPQLRKKNPYIAFVDKTKVLDLDDRTLHPNLGKNEYGAFDRDLAIEQAKELGYEGMSYTSRQGKLVTMWKPVYVEQSQVKPSLSDVVSGKWDNLVEDAKTRLNKGYYGGQILDITTTPAIGVKFISDMSIIVADKFLKTKTPFGTPAQFAKKLIDEYEQAVPMIRRFAREIYEMAKSLVNNLKKQPITYEQVDAIKNTIEQKLNNGEGFDEYIPIGKGITLVAGDALDFEGGERKAVGIRFPEDQALRVLKANKKIQMVNVAIKDAGGKVFQGKVVDGIAQTHGDLQTQLERDGIISPDENITDGFIGNNGKFYTREETNAVTGAWGEAVNQGLIPVTFMQMAPEVQETLKYKGRKSYPVWATSKVVARNIEKGANEGNDTLVFMQYPNLWESLKDNYTFHRQLYSLILNTLIDNNASVKGMEPFPESTDGNEWRNYYLNKLPELIRRVRSLPNVGSKMWTKQSLALRFSVENGINLKGKIRGVAKFKQLNSGDSRIDPHAEYDIEIEGYNYIPLEEPIDYKSLFQETKKAGVGLTERIKQENDKARQEQFRRSSLWITIQQRGLTVTKEQSELAGALIAYSEGDNTLINNWMQKNPDYAGEIVDQVKHNEWLNKNKDVVEQLRQAGIKQFTDLYMPADFKQKPDLSEQFVLSMNGFFNPQMWKSLGVVAKAIGRSAKGFAQFGSKLVKAVGEWVRPLLRSLWQLVRQMPNIFMKATPKQVDYSTRIKQQTSPEVKAEIQKKSTHPTGDLPSSTSGYNLNTEHPKLQSMLESTVTSIRKEFNERRRGRLSNEELIRRAKVIASKLSDADILDLEVGSIKTAEDATAIRIYIADQMLKNQDQLDELNEESDPTQMKDAMDNFVRINRMWQIARSVGTEGGRLVQAFSIPMDDDVIGGFRNLINSIKKLDPENRYGGDIISNQLEEIVKAPQENKEQRKTALDYARYIFFNWILQNPLTDIANTFGNFSNLGFHVTANIGNLGGMRTLWRGIRKGLKEGVKDARATLHGQQEEISKFSEGVRVTVPSSGTAKDYLRLLVPTTRLGIEDNFFRALGRNIETERMVTKTSRKLGVAPDEVYNALDDLLNDPEGADFVKDDYKELATYLKNIEDELVFQNELGAIGKGFQKVSKVAFPIIPFVTTPANILKFGVSATPFGALKLFRKGLSTEQRNQITRRALAGSVLLSGLAGLVAQGVVDITGSGSDDPYERDLMAKLGYKPNSLYINTPWGKFGGSYQNVNPVNISLSLVGNLIDKYRFNKLSSKPEDDLAWYDEWAKNASEGLIGVASSLTDQSFLTGVRDLMDALAGRKPDWLMRMLTGYARVGAIQGTEQALGLRDRGIYDTRGRMMEQLQKNFPLTSNEGLIKNINRFGEQRQSTYERFPLPISKISNDPAINWLAESGLTMSEAKGTSTKLGNRKLTRKEGQIYEQVVGQLMDETIHQIYETENKKKPEDKTSLEDLQDKIDNAYRSAKKYALGYIKKKIIEQYNLEEGNK